MTYAEKLAFDTANEVFELDLICKRIDEFESRSVESTIQAAISKAMQAQREACGNTAYYLSNKLIEQVWMGNQDEFTWADREDMAEQIRQAILNAEVKP